MMERVNQLGIVLRATPKEEGIDDVIDTLLAKPLDRIALGQIVSLVDYTSDFDKQDDAPIGGLK